jgi:hypothetical protein
MIWTLHYICMANTNLMLKLVAVLYWNWQKCNKKLIFLLSKMNCSTRTVRIEQDDDIYNVDVSILTSGKVGKIVKIMFYVKSQFPNTDPEDQYMLNFEAKPDFIELINEIKKEESADVMPSIVAYFCDEFKELTTWKLETLNN